MTAAVQTREWLAKFARILELGHATVTPAVNVGFVKAPTRRRGSPDFVRVISQLKEDHTSRLGWKYDDFGLVRLWSHLERNDLICELLPVIGYPREVLQMWYAMHAVYRELCRRGGLPLHCGLLERDGRGVLLLAGEGTGKSTCCRRIQPPWKALSDDLVIVVPAGEGGYQVHPLPTWSDHIIGDWDRTWNVEQGLPLAGLFFLEQGNRDEALPIGQGRASVASSKSASYVCTRDWVIRDAEQARTLRKTLFRNAAALTRNVPAWILKASLTGQLWLEIEKALAARHSH